jgi:hypothetical protein
MGWLIAILIVLGIALIIWYGWYATKKRREGLARTAAHLGMQYAEGDPFNLLSLPFVLLRRGAGRGCENVLWGTWEGMDVKEFDYWFYTESRDSKGNRTRSYSYFSCLSTEVTATVPHIAISRESFFGRLADGLGFRDFEFELEEFNRAFQVKGPERKFASDLIDQRMMRWLLASEKGWSFEFSGTHLMCFSRRRKPTELMPLFETLKSFRQQIPRVVWNLYGSDPGENPQQKTSGSA